MSHKNQANRPGTNRHIGQSSKQRSNVNRVKRRKLISNLSRRQLSAIQQRAESILQGIPANFARLAAHNRRQNDLCLANIRDLKRMTMPQGFQLTPMEAGDILPKLILGQQSPPLNPQSMMVGKNLRFIAAILITPIKIQRKFTTGNIIKHILKQDFSSLILGSLTPIGSCPSFGCN